MEGKKVIVLQNIRTGTDLGDHLFKLLIRKPEPTEALTCSLSRS